MIVVRSRPPLKIPTLRSLQVPTRKLILPPKPKISVADEGVTLDRKTHMLLEQVLDEVQYLNDTDTKELWIDIVDEIRKTGDIDKLIELTKWRRKVVSMEEFMFSKTYLDLNQDEIYPGVVEACTALDSEQYNRAVLKGALGGGKSTVGNIMLARSLYKLSCMRHPQSTFGIQSRTALVFTIQSIRLSTAKKAVFSEFGNYISHSPYFKTVYPFDPLVTSQMIFREQNVTIMPVASSSTGAISMNVIGGILDEMNFMQKIVKSKSSNADDEGSFDQAKQVYEAISNRRVSRFAKLGKLPGILFLISSSRFPDDFTEIQAAKAEMCGGTDKTIYVWSKSVWESKGRDRFMPESFRVQIGTASIRSKVLEDGEVAHPQCERVIEVPMDFIDNFRDDVNKAIRDFAGITTLVTRPFISRREVIYSCMEAGKAAKLENPFPLEQYDFSLALPQPDTRKLRTDIPAWRTCHLDLGLKRDACGLAIGHLAGQKLIEKTDPVSGKKIVELMPMIAYDVILRIVPPPNGEIEFAKLREFIIMLRDTYKLPITTVTTDGFQSVDSRQILRTHGFTTDYLSVEKIGPYRTLRDALYDERVLLPNHQFLANELAGLEYVTSQSGDKVDHRQNGTKDVSDAVAGVASLLLSRREAWHGAIANRETALRAAKVGTDVAEMQNEVDKLVKAGGPIRKLTFRKSINRRTAFRK